MSKNNKSGFSSVEVLLVVSAILVFAYCAAPAVHGVGSALGKWMSTPSAAAAKNSGTPAPVQCCAPAPAPVAPANAAASDSVLKHGA